MSSANVNYISLHEAAKLTNYSQDYISLLCRQKKLKGEKLGRNWVTTKEWVENYINKTKGSGQNIIPVRIESKNEVLEHIPNSSPRKNGAQQEGNKKQATNLFPRENDNSQKSIPIFFQKNNTDCFCCRYF